MSEYIEQIQPRAVKVTETPDIPLTTGDTPAIDAFGRLRTSHPYTVFDSKQIFDNQPLFFDDAAVSGSGTTSSHSVNTASTTIGVSATTAGRRVRQTFMRFNYQPGKSQLAYLTGVLVKTGGGTGIIQSFGLYDDQNGIFLRNNEGTIQVGIRSYTTGSAANNTVNRSNWNLDRMDGSGPSKLNLDFTKIQIFVIDFEWLGAGRVRVGFVNSGMVHYVHEFIHTNILSKVYMSTPNLPVRYEIENLGTGAASTLEHVCSSVISEGGIDKNGILRHKDSGAISGLSAGTAYVIMGGRLKSTHLGASVTIENISLIGSSNDQAHWELRIGGTVGAALTYADMTNSAVQTAAGSSSHTITGGVDIDGGYFTTNIAANFTVPNANRLGAKIDNTPQEWYLVVTPITNNITVRASITWRELS